MQFRVDHLAQTKQTQWPPQLKLVLLPGLDGTGLLFEPFLQEFPNRKQLEIVSYPADKNLDYEQLTEIVLEEYIPDSGDFVLLAESFSGPIAARLFDHPRLVAVIFCASFLRTPRPLLLRLFACLPLSRLLRIRCPAFILKFACLGSYCPESTIALFRKAIALVHPQVLEYRVRLLKEINDLKRIERRNLPICYLRPSDDKLIPTSCVRDIRGAANSVVLREVEGSHFLLQSSPKQALIAICEFCSAICCPR
jgi:hypothetical protein